MLPCTILVLFALFIAATALVAAVFTSAYIRSTMTYAQRVRNMTQISFHDVEYRRTLPKLSCILFVIFSLSLLYCSFLLEISRNHNQWRLKSTTQGLYKKYDQV